MNLNNNSIHRGIMETIIDTLIDRHSKVVLFLEQQEELTLKIDVENEFRKVLVLSIGSFFEDLITNAVMDLARSTNSIKIENFIKRKAITRQYHTFFSWDEKNINSFLKLFGDEFKTITSSTIKDNASLSNGAVSFLRLGSRRNMLVHENFAASPIDWTTEEIITMYRESLDFINYLSEQVKNI